MRLSQLWCRPANFSEAEPHDICTPLMQIPPMVTDYRGHRQTLFPVQEMNPKAYVDAILTQITWPALGIEPRAMHKQLFNPPRTILSHRDRAPKHPSNVTSFANKNYRFTNQQYSYCTCSPCLCCMYQCCLLPQCFLELIHTVVYSASVFLNFFEPTHLWKNTGGGAPLWKN